MARMVELYSTPHRKQRRMSQWKVLGSGGIYYVTTTIVNWNNVFTSEPYFEIIIQSLNYYIHEKELHVHGYVIMPNHAHYILSVNENINLSDVMRDYKRYTSKAITGLLKNDKRRGVLREFYQNSRGPDSVKLNFHPSIMKQAGFLDVNLYNI
jgi:REP element-mobilizing transposase RayT